MGRPRKDLSAAEEQASRLISAQKIFESLQHGRSFGIHGIPQKHRAGAQDPDDRTGNARLQADYKYYRIAAPDSNEGRRQTEFIMSMGYEAATDGEYFPSMPGGKIYKCHPLQHNEANKAMKMIAVQEHSKAAESERHRLQETARYKFGTGEVTAEIDSREIDPRNL